MEASRNITEGGYRYIPAVLRYSAGVAALPGFRIERVRFSDPVPLADGFKRISQFIKEAGRPLNSLCACELRSPGQFSDRAFAEFNERYVGVLRDWNILDDNRNPVARSNVCPAFGAPAEPSFHAFSFARKEASSAQSFIVAGSAEAPELEADYLDRIVAHGNVGTDGMRQKVRFVLTEQEQRMAALGTNWSQTTDVQVYTVHDFRPLIADELAPRAAMRQGLTWHYCRPPVTGLEFEMDCRGIASERVLSA